MHFSTGIPKPWFWVPDSSLTKSITVQHHYIMSPKGVGEYLIFIFFLRGRTEISQYTTIAPKPSVLCFVKVITRAARTE